MIELIERLETNYQNDALSIRGTLKKIPKKPVFFSLVLFMLLNQFSTATSCAQIESRKEDPAGKSVDYLTEIKPLLREKCFACHSSLKQEGGLRLDATSLIRKGGDSGPILVAGSIENSSVLDRLTDHEDSRMPPAEAGSRLSAEELTKLTRWIKSGAVAPDEAIPEHPSRHWSFLPPVKAELPTVSAHWVRNDIDRFLADEHERIGVNAVGETSRSMLLRRASLALTGIPPTLAERQAFLDDKSEAAYENAVDRLLESPRYGERWARHFMDIWRYSDPSGYGKEIRDGRQHLWRWRDWIVDSLNSDKGYDRMIVEMLAADEDSPEDQDALRATGFLARNWYKFNRNVWLDNIVEHSSKAFLGLTVNCARCHDHKYDPIGQTAYYQMRAVFETHDVRDEPLQQTTPGSANGMLVRVYDAHLDRQTFTFSQGDENRPDKIPLSPGLPELFGELSVQPVSLPMNVWYPGLRKENREAALKSARAEVDSASAALEKARVNRTASEKTLADCMKSDPRSSKPLKSKAMPVIGKNVLNDDFSKLNLDQWKIEGGRWSAKDGRVVQSIGATKQHRLVSRTVHPRDFRAKLRLKITGGETYKSVGLGFDGHGLAMNAVYLSVSGPKVQFTSQGLDGRWQYPTAGMAPESIKTGQDYVLEVAVKDQLLNILIDGDLKVAYNLPNRKAGRISVWAFSATAEFDQLDVTTLPATARLEPVAGGLQTSPQLHTKNGLQQALKTSTASEKAAIAHLQTKQSALTALNARMAAETVKHGLARGDSKALAKAAGRASRQHALDKIAEQIAQAELKIEQTRQRQQTAAQADRAKAANEQQAAEKQLVDLRKNFKSAKGQLENGSLEYPALGKRYPKTSSGRRLALARWISDQKNPLAARVLVNHVWLRHFDLPLVERTFDFGLRSEKPRHAKLLDWLAVQFMEDGWSLKKLHKRILMSGIYRRSSSLADATTQSRSIDPDNLTMWRMNARRMEAEVIRDSVLSLGGSLVNSMGGPPIEHTQGQTVFRRSLYFRQDKERQMTFLGLFDGAKVNECYDRKSTVAPQQALALFNSPIAAGQARKIAKAHQSFNSDHFVKLMFELVLCREPTDTEHRECLQFLDEFGGNEAARHHLVLVLLNHNDFVTIR